MIDLLGRRARRENAELKRVILWATGRDTGMSSEFMAQFLATGCSEFVAYPHDGGDLGRCIRFLRVMDWEHCAPEMAAASPEWAALVTRWDDLVTLYDLSEDEEDEYERPPSRRGPNYEQRRAAWHERNEARPGMKLYRLMKELLDPVEAVRYGRAA